ncbi:hypothetical protein PGQ11_011264 [Apiospora arundinis]|uniref:Uncharacterized protein n=1 Tax=Apiospora arundinis TaxID=335852 RepID=A0ABR2HZ40_9PEZI
MKATEHQGPRGHPQINALKSADSWSSAIDTIGLRVLSCDMTKAQQNNEAFTGAQDTGYEPLRPSSHKQPLTALEAFQILLRPQPAPQNQEVVALMHQIKR